MTDFVSYFRVSTARQGQSGLGLDAQRTAVDAFVATGDWAPVGEFIETESGKKNDRPQLAAALAQCKKDGATLIIAKLDRLSRNTRFLLGIIESGIEVLFCDLPHIPPGAMGKFVLTQMAAIAELEGQRISERTRDALAALKARGVTRAGRQIDRLGASTEQLNSIGGAGRDKQIAAAQQFAANTKPIIDQITGAGITTLRGIAAALTARGVVTKSGASTWHPQQVKAVIDRMAA
jgi:DNA invertase Pin-like site-specific DNA recombinase